MTLPVLHTGRDATRWGPFREVDDLYARMGRLVDAAFADVMKQAWVPAVDIEETEDAYQIDAELPGVKREDVSVEVHNGELSITGELKEQERTGILRRKTRRTGRFEYHVSLARDVDAEKVEATLDEGVLRVRAPKTAQSQPRRIQVKS